ncbi:MAG: aspartyl-phosphate phosphatase Spo0E family protein [Pelosinus sp.]|nr:aspartyl-phosphate phosphatase Spo0E family protein [Pelosinus sp.]
MLNLNEQQHEIETLRLRLHELVLAKSGNLADQEVTDLSAMLDTLIVRYEKTKAENLKPQLSLR